MSYDGYAQDQANARAAADAAWTKANEAWKSKAAIASHGGPPAGPAPKYSDFLDPKFANLVEPNLAGASGGVASSDATGSGGVDAFNNGGPTPVNTANALPPGGGGVPAAGPAPNLSSGERTTYDIDDTHGEQDRDQQLAYIEALKARAEGRAPSYAEALLHQQNNTINRNAQGLAAQARGTDAVAARRAAILGGAGAAAQSAQAAAALRIQEQTQAQDLLGGALHGLRTTDTGHAEHVADQTATTGKGNLDRESTERINSGSQAVTREDIAARERAGKYNADQTLNAAKIAGGAAFGGGLLDAYLKYKQLNPVG